MGGKDSSAVSINRPVVDNIQSVIACERDRRREDVWGNGWRKDSPACYKEFVAFGLEWKYSACSLSGPLEITQLSVNMLQFPPNRSWQ